MFQGKGLVCRFTRRIAIIATAVLVFAPYGSLAQEFAPPVNISGETGNAAAPRIAVDSHGNIDVVWLDSRSGVPAVLFSRSSDGGETFSAPLGVSNQPRNSAQAERLAVDSVGNIYVVWSEQLSRTQTVMFSRSTDNGGTFSVPRVISNGSIGIEPMIAIDPAGAVNLAWIDNSPGYAALFYSRSNDEGWSFSTPIQLSAAQPAGDPNIAVDSRGYLYIIWTAAAADGKQPGELFFTDSTGEGTAFLPPVKVSNRQQDKIIGTPIIAADSPSNINILWTTHVALSSDTFVYTHSNDGGANFGAVFIASTNGIPQLALDSSGGANIVWPQPSTDGKSMIHFARFVAGLISTTAVIASSFTPNAYPQIATDPRRGIHVGLLASSNLGNPPSLALVYSTDEGITFNHTDSVSLDAGMDSPQMATGSGGESYFVGSRAVNDGSRQIFFSRDAAPVSSSLNPASVASNGYTTERVMLGGPPPATGPITAWGTSTSTALPGGQSSRRPAAPAGVKSICELHQEHLQTHTVGSDPCAQGPAQSSVPITSYSVNNIEYVDCVHYSCLPDIGVGIRAAVAALPSTGGLVYLPSGIYNSSNLTISKPAHFICPNRGATVISFTTGSGTAVLFNYGSGAGGSYEDWGAGFYNCTLLGPGGYAGGAANAGTGIQAGDASHASEGLTLENVYVSGFALGLTWGNSGSWATTCRNSSFTNNNQQVFYNLSDGIENVKFDHCVFGADQFTTGMLTTAVQLAGTAGGQFEFDDCSFDDAQLAVSAGTTRIWAANHENPGGNAPNDYIVVSGSGYVIETGADYKQDQTAGSMPTQFIDVTGGNYVGIGGWYQTAPGTTVANILSTSGTANASVLAVRGVSGTFRTSYNYGASGAFNTLYDQLGNINIGGPITTINSPTINLSSAPTARGSSPSLSGTGACATTNTQIGGSWSGSFLCTGTSGSSTAVITFTATAPHGWNCAASDQTVGTTMPQSANNSTSCTIKGNVNSNDVIVFTATEY